MIVALVLIVLFGAAPFIAALAAMILAGALGCPLNAGGAHACLMFGRDIGPALQTVLGGHWFALMTMPGAVMALVVWAVVALILLLLHRRRRRRRAL